MNIKMNLNCMIMITLCKLTYDLELYKQTLKRVHHLEQKEKIFVYVLFFNMTIEKYVEFQSQRVQDCRCNIRFKQANFNKY